MAMKQTQTKLFDFADAGLDFCVASKNLFPDRFKKMLALGYNEQTVSSVTVAGNQVTLSYGVSHGYVADRVLKVNAPELLGINGGEFVIDSVTANTVTMTIDGAPASIMGNFTTKVASLGWSLVYEQANIHIYKLKSLDESDLYLRLCFQDVSNYRNCIQPCVGKTADLTQGVITDPDSIKEHRAVMSPLSGFKWDFEHTADSSRNNYSYTQGFNSYGRAMIVGSNYHFLISANRARNTSWLLGILNGICPIVGLNNVKLPVLIGENGPNSSVSAAQFALTNSRLMLGKHALKFNIDVQRPNSSFLSAEFENFNTTVAAPIQPLELSTGQPLGYLMGIYKPYYSSNLAEQPPVDAILTPSIHKDIDLNSTLIVSGISNGGAGSSNHHYAIAVEEIKVAN